MEVVVYILYSEKLDKFYIGYSENMEQRIGFHNSEENLKWTKSGAPWQIYLLISCATVSQARKIERYIKQQKSKKYILQLIERKDMVENLKSRFFEG